jgi:hypothetical protein
VSDVAVLIGSLDQYDMAVLLPRLLVSSLPRVIDGAQTAIDSTRLLPASYNQEKLDGFFKNQPWRILLATSWS